MQEGMLTVISGFSGSGKSTITRALIETYPNYALSVSATTRTPRSGEEEGIDYFFKTEKEFVSMIESDAFLEYAYYVDHAYGTPQQYVDERLQEGKDVLLEIEIQGALKVKAKRPDTILIFVTPPSAKELIRRLENRGTESEEVRKSRLRRAVEESSDMALYDYLLINDDLEDSVLRLHELIQRQHERTSQQRRFIESIQKELKEQEEII